MAKKKTPTPDKAPQPEPEKGAARALAVARTMAAVGFSPRERQSVGHIEYRKEYTDGLGRRALVTALIDRGISGLDHARLDGFVVTLQFHVAATDEAVDRVSEDLRPDMRAIVKLLGSDETFATSDVTCEACGTVTAEFKLGAKNAILCPACHTKAHLPEEIDI